MSEQPCNSKQHGVSIIPVQTAGIGSPIHARVRRACASSYNILVMFTREGDGSEFMAVVSSAAGECLRRQVLGIVFFLASYVIADDYTTAVFHQNTART